MALGYERCETSAAVRAGDTIILGSLGGRLLEIGL
jgi:hypothetical protein|tara:strand:+ start:868 stop:972 length:105 start_codon:yes stop_codon:yes gene_type:complete